MKHDNLNNIIEKKLLQKYNRKGEREENNTRMFLAQPTLYIAAHVYIHPVSMSYMSAAHHLTH